jgi:regulator of protease activity HflC (stomatin/prohibitin superfamily)
MEKGEKGFVGLVVIAVLVILGLVTVASATESVDIGERVVVVGYGEIKDVLTEGFHFVNPLYSTYSFDIRNTKYEASANAASQDLQKVGISVVVNYELVDTAVADVYKTYGQNYIERIFSQNVQESIKSVSAKYPATELVTKRDDVKKEFKNRLQETMPGVVRITDVAITNVDFSDSFDESVERKVKAEQDALTAKNRLEQIKTEADQRVAQAEGEAKAISAQAKAIQSQGGREYVQLKAIERWNGILPAQMIPGSAVPFIDLK